MRVKAQHSYVHGYRRGDRDSQRHRIRPAGFSVVQRYQRRSQAYMRHPGGCHLGQSLFGG